MRFPAFATSLAVHAMVLASVLLVPILGNEPLPQTTASEPPIPLWPSPRVAIADARPVVPSLRRGVPRRRTDTPITPIASELMPAPASAETVDHDIASDPMAVEDNVPDAIGAGGACCGTGAETETESGPEGGGLGTGPGLGGGTGPVRAGGLVRAPKKVRHVDPVYPEIARAARISATVVLDCLLDVEGRVTEIRVVSGHPLLDAAAKDAVARWRYTPTYLNDTAVPVLLTVTVRFTLGR
jgi:periplasmic protein TonB